MNYVTEQGTQAPGSSRKAILEAANRVGEASNDFLRYVMQDSEVTEGEIVPEEDERVYQVYSPLNNFLVCILAIHKAALFAL